MNAKMKIVPKREKCTNDLSEDKMKRCTQKRLYCTDKGVNTTRINRSIMAGGIVTSWHRVRSPGQPNTVIHRRKYRHAAGSGRLTSCTAEVDRNNGDVNSRHGGNTGQSPMNEVDAAGVTVTGRLPARQGHRHHVPTGRKMSRQVTAVTSGHRQDRRSQHEGDEQQARTRRMEGARWAKCKMYFPLY